MYWRMNEFVINNGLKCSPTVPQKFVYHATDLEMAVKVKLETNKLLDVCHSKWRRTKKKVPEPSLSANHTITVSD